MNTVSVWKRSVAIFLAALMIVGMIPLSQMMATETLAASTITVYFRNDWLWSDVRVHYWGGSSSSSWPGASMTSIDTQNNYTIYSAEIPADSTGFLFTGQKNDNTGLDQSPDITDIQTNMCYYMVWNNGNAVQSFTYKPGYFVAGSSGLCGEEWNTTADQMTQNSDGTYSITFSNIAAGSYIFKVVKNANYDFGSWPTENYSLTVDETSNVTITFDPSNGNINVAVEEISVTETYDRMGEMTLSSNSVFYVDVDLVDYLNDNRVAKGEVSGYYTDNQGIWLTDGDAPYSYLNHLISKQAYYGNYSTPLYFGPLYFIASRYSREVGNTTYESLGKWSSAANVAVATPNSEGALNTDAVVQGLLDEFELDSNGNLVSKTKKDENGNPIPFLYFSQEAAENWTNNGYKVMAYYADLQFPFVMKYDEDNRVTTYSYDSASDYAVYYDYTNRQLYASSMHILDSENDNDKSATDYGFYPLNEPDDTSNEVNNGFGAKFTVDFTVGEDGVLANGKPVTFDFTGDDDVWVFIDGVLVLDMGGAHAKASGHIDFSALTATVTDACSVSNSYVIDGDTDALSTYQNQGLANWLYDGDTVERATVSASTVTKKFEDLGLSFDYDKVHTMTVFYMERGMLESNFKMEFTMVPVPSGLTISKELNDEKINAGLLDEVSAAEDYNFEVTATSPNSTSVAFPNYSLTEKNTGKTTSKTTSVSSNGNAYSATISGITNDTYAHSFVASNGEDAFIPGTTFSIVESTNGIFSYSGTSWAIYDANNGYVNITSSVKTSSSSTSSKTAAFTMGSVSDTTAYSYAVTFTNTMLVGTLKVSKTFSDEKLGDTEFKFNVYLDLDGSKTNFEEALYPGLVYTVGNETRTSSDGTITLKGGETAIIAGIPAGATYRVVEDVPEWSIVSSENATGSIGNGTTQTAKFTNTVKSTTVNKTIYVEAGTATDYTVKYDGQVVTITSVGKTDGLTVDNHDTYLKVTGTDPDEAYTVSYSGRLPNNEIVSGTITVYTFAATDKVYVFDFGLQSAISNTTSENNTGDGLFEKGVFHNSGTTTTATLISITPASTNSQTTISENTGGTISALGVYSKTITFTPVAFMSKVENYTYQVWIGTTSYSASNASDPEKGTLVTGTIKVMPANTVYYEDNFNTSADAENEKIIFSANAPTSSPTLSQSNDQSTNYGKDDCYNGGYTTSNKSETTLKDGQYAYFTFTGTGFDLISRTNSETAGLAVYVFETDAYSANDLKYVTDLTYTGDHSEVADRVFVNNYYNNGDLYQVPVVSVRLADYGTYTVYIQCLSTYVSVNDKTLTSVTIDGVRIYDPLGKYDATNNKLDGYLENEKNTTVNEFRALYLLESKLSLACRNGSTVAAGLGKGYVIVENMGDKSNYSTVTDVDVDDMNVQDLMDIYVHGPNNEMYLPDEFGIQFSYTVTDAKSWTMQIGAKALTSSKTVSIYARKANGSYAFVDTVTVESTTDMYYDLTDMLKEGYGAAGTYDIIIISDTEDSNSNFVSLTTVKYSGMTLN